jgi:hypothetical protein
MLMIDTSAAREGFNRHEITNVCLIRSEYNVADAVTKLSSNHALHRFIKTHRVDHSVEQYVFDPSPHGQSLVSYADPSRGFLGPSESNVPQIIAEKPKKTSGLDK